MCCRVSLKNEMKCSLSNVSVIITNSKQQQQRLFQRLLVKLNVHLQRRCTTQMPIYDNFMTRIPRFLYTVQHLESCPLVPRPKLAGQSQSVVIDGESSAQVTCWVRSATARHCSSGADVVFVSHQRPPHCLFQCQVVRRWLLAVSSHLLDIRSTSLTERSWYTTAWCDRWGIYILKSVSEFVWPVAWLRADGRVAQIEPQSHAARLCSSCRLMQQNVKSCESRKRMQSCRNYIPSKESSARSQQGQIPRCNYFERFIVVSQCLHH